LSRQKANRYPFNEFEPAWQERWEGARIFHADRDESRPKWFIIELPPFANGKLHLGHVRNYSLADASARFRRMAGHNVLYTTGFDSFGLPNENAAHEAKCHPEILAERCIVEMRRQFVQLGLGHDRRRIVGYHEPVFYRWVQWVFLQLVHAGLAFRQQAKVNWCPSCDTALADSLIEAGGCWRCGSAVESRLTWQWFVREQDYADGMLEAMGELDRWPDLVKQIQTEWIGRREGVEARFVAIGADDVTIPAFLDEPALLPAVSFVGVGPGHPALEALRRAGRLEPAVLDALDDLARRTLTTRDARKHGHGAGEAIRLGISVRHPLNGAELPLLALEQLDLRDGAVAGCPGHVRADRRLAEELGLPGPITLEPPHGSTAEPADFDAHWRLVGAGALDGATVVEGRARIAEMLAAAGLGGRAVRYRLRDWNIARQRYWGTPIPVIHCDACGAVPVPESELAVELPRDVDFDTRGNPLERHAAFIAARCPRCGGSSRRDTDTLEAYSSPWWYHWHCRTLSNDNPFDPADTRYWMPVDLMVGGIDQSRTCFFHTRMMARALKAMGHVLHDEPVRELLAIGMVKQDGRKMSKSAGNLVDPDAMIGIYGADAVRLGVLGAAAPPSDLSWSDQSVRQAQGFLAELWQFVEERQAAIRLDRPEAMAMSSLDTATPLRRRLAGWLQTAAARVTANMVRHELHLAVKNGMFLFERLVQFEREARARGDLAPADAAALSIGVGVLLRLLAPIAPHIAEELWCRAGGPGLLAVAPWPAPLEPPGGRKPRKDARGEPAVATHPSTEEGAKTDASHSA
jgi:leucyl-tRNA synthetase